jgi:hypothetical protein
MVDGVAREDEGGESACFAHLTCPECGVMFDGSAHLTECHWVTLESGFVMTHSDKPEASP